MKVRFEDRNGQPIFSDLMLIITNKVIKLAEDALLVYSIYLKRSRIEYVFKFLKNGLWLEEMQLQDFQDDYVVLLAKLGGGKGVVSQHYIFKGIHTLIINYFFVAARILKYNARLVDLAEILYACRKGRNYHSYL